MLVDHLDVRPEKIKTVEDGEAISLGDKTLRFIQTPWVHWPETMVTHLPEDRILFSCDFFGSHLATSELYAGNDPYVWGTKVVEQISGLITNLKVDVLGTVICKGLPRKETFSTLDALADTIQEKHSLF